MLLISKVHKKKLILLRRIDIFHELLESMIIRFYKAPVDSWIPLSRAKIWPRKWGSHEAKYFSPPCAGCAKFWNCRIVINFATNSTGSMPSFIFLQTFKIEIFLIHDSSLWQFISNFIWKSYAYLVCVLC